MSQDSRHPESHSTQRQYEEPWASFSDQERKDYNRLGRQVIQCLREALTEDNNDWVWRSSVRPADSDHGPRWQQPVLDKLDLYWTHLAEGQFFLEPWQMKVVKKTCQEMRTRATKDCASGTNLSDTISKLDGLIYHLVCSEKAINRPE
jgi:hypothetical protein